MMNAPVSRRDLEALSAYLDGRLSHRQRRRLEKRLQSDPDLQTALEDLRRTRALLRAAPAPRAPRNFTLTPQMLGQPLEQPSRWVPALRLVSAMASILFVLVLLGDFFSGVGFPGGAAPMALQEAALETVVVEREGETIIVTATPMEAQAQEPLAEAAEEEGEAATLEQPAAEAPLAEATPTPAATAERTFLQTEEAVPPTESRTPTLEAGAPAEDQALAPTETELSDLATPGAGLAQQEPLEREEEAPSGPTFRLRWLLVVEGVLALLAVLSGLAAFLLRRRGAA